jgi:uncharacterized cupin superfamily protein
MAKIDKAVARDTLGSAYPAPFDVPCRNRSVLRLAEAAKLTQFGVNLVRLPPGTWSSQRHWHSHEDEFVYVLEGEVVLVTDSGQELLRAGDSAGFKAGSKDGHHAQNRSSGEAVLLVVGSRVKEDHGEYPDIDLIFTDHGSGKSTYLHKDRTPY